MDDRSRGDSDTRGQHAEILAWFIVDQSGLAYPDPLPDELAVALGFEVWLIEGHPSVRRSRVVFVDSRLPPKDRQMSVARAMARWFYPGTDPNVHEAVAASLTEHRYRDVSSDALPAQYLGKTAS